MTSVWRIIVILVLSIVSPLLAAQTLDAPRGWKESVTPQGRIITKGNTKLVLGTWQSLEGVSLENYIESIKDTPADGMSIVSVNALVPESNVKGAYSVNREVMLNGKSSLSVLYGCPGLPGHARIFSLIGRTKNLLQLIAAARFAEKVCKEEPKGKPLEESQANDLDSTSQIEMVDTETNVEEPIASSAESPTPNQGSTTGASTRPVGNKPNFSSKTIKAPKRWKDRNYGGNRSVERDWSKISVGKWQDLKGVSLNALMESHKDTTREYVEILSTEELKKVNGLFILNRKSKYRGESGASVAFGCPGQPGHARVIWFESYSPKDIPVGFKHAANICFNEPKGREAKVIPFETIAFIPNLKDVWFTGDFWSGMNGTLRAVWHTYLTFNDGVVTRDLKPIFEIGVEASQIEVTDSWEHFKESDGKLWLEGKDGKLQDNLFFSYKLIAGKPNERLTGCWKHSSHGGGEMGDVTGGMGTISVSFSFDSLCFSKDGQFTVDKSSSFSIAGRAGGVRGSGGGSNESSNVGRYRVDGHVIVFETADGVVSRNTFGWNKPDGKEKTLIIGHKQYKPDPP